MFSKSYSIWGVGVGLGHDLEMNLIQGPKSKQKRINYIRSTQTHTPYVSFAHSAAAGRAVRHVTIIVMNRYFLTECHRQRLGWSVSAVIRATRCPVVNASDICRPHILLGKEFLSELSCALWKLM